MRPPEVTRVSELLSVAAAEEIVPRFENLAAADVREKSPGELVTAADEAMERRLAPALSALLSGSVVVGEEATAADERLLKLLEGEDPVWLIDPLDGTANFAAGRPVFGVMVCLVLKAELVAAWIHDPISRKTLAAEAGSGAQIDGAPLRIVPPVGRPLNASISTQFFPTELRAAGEAAQEMFEHREPWHCAARTYLDLVTGALDVAMFYRLMPWDHAPGVLIHRESGGFSTGFSGAPYSPLVHSGGLFLGPDEQSWRALSSAFSGARD